MRKLEYLILLAVLVSVLAVGFTFTYTPPDGHWDRVRAHWNR